ncbi:Cytochrome c553 [Poseidonocella pacifica]|uniref:Cytochrome c553 n=1 Tax=Poseidonocella pacifica TaxID=871651 RepID=A0A1I0Y2L3_9RHOB|nr:c-type cytochrome [Poseidonocella pacifica]SFB07117.1 Cytochrome c553 [Poseidonocella pacifica]
MRRVLGIVLGGLLLAGPLPAQEAGRKVAGQCRTCHGLDGIAAIPIAPNIGGEPAAYLQAQLLAFKTGAREHEMMSVVAAGLSEQQIADVADWYAAQNVTATLTAPEEDAPELCTACHGVDGIAVAEDAPNLAGEPNIYIVTQLKAFRIGKREHAVMSEIAKGLSDAEMRAVADWYAAIDLTAE